MSSDGFLPGEDLLGLPGKWRKLGKQGGVQQWTHGQEGAGWCRVASHNVQQGAATAGDQWQQRGGAVEGTQEFVGQL